MMNPDLWTRVAELYHAAMERPAGEREEFVTRESGGDAELRREVESLLAYEGEAGSLLEDGPFKTLAAGSGIGIYRIVAKLGQGGMGEVFRAIDTRLDREVALKVVARKFAEDPVWVSRLRREARVLASLNHPNIAAIYGLEESDGQCAIAMELVEGASLAERMARGRIPVPEALRIATQIAEALEYAHEAGIVHRDLKPGNVRLRRDGVVKVLDFGLAKTIESKESPVETATRTGMVMGTPAYMPPEQAAGEHVDKRADIWAFGVVLFEMLAGGHVYARKTTPETLAALTRDEPRWQELPAETPTPIIQLLRRCLDKDAKRRLRDIGEARISFEYWQAGKTREVAPPAQKSRRWSAAAWLFAAAMAGVALLAVLWPRPSIMPVMTGILLGGPGEPQCPRPSPDGHMLAFFTLSGDERGMGMENAQSQVGVIKPETGDSLILTHGAEYGWINSLSWSPDGSRIYFDRIVDVPRGIFSVPVLGGKEQLVLENAGSPESLPDGSLLVAKINAERKLQLCRFWPETGRLQGYAVEVSLFDIRASPDGRDALVIGKQIGSGGDAGSHVYAVDLASGKVRQVASGLADDSALSAVAMTRDGKSILMASQAGIGSQVAAVPRNGGGQPRLLLSLTLAIYAMDTGPNGAIYLDQVNRPADIVRFRPAGGRAEKIGTVAFYEGGPFAVLPDGRVAVQVTTAAHTRVVVFEPGKSAVPLVSTSEETRTPATAVGANRVAFFVGPAEHPTIGLADTGTGRIQQRIPFDKGSPSALAATPDGRTLYCAATGTVWSIPLNGGEPKRLHAGDYVAADPHGQYLLIELVEGAGYRLLRVPLHGGPDQEITVRSKDRPAYQITSSAVGSDGRILSPITSQAFYWPAGVIDPTTGIAKRIPVSYFGDYHGLAWTPDGQVIGMVLDDRSKMWEFVPERRGATH